MEARLLQKNDYIRHNYMYILSNIAITCFPTAPTLNIDMVIYIIIHGTETRLLNKYLRLSANTHFRNFYICPF